MTKLLQDGTPLNWQTVNTPEFPNMAPTNDSDYYHISSNWAKFSLHHQR